jgi:2-haloacid dehalogenase
MCIRHMQKDTRLGAHGATSESMMLKLEPLPKVITFDCYGTLVQWHRAVRAASRALLSRHFPDGNIEEQTSGLADRLREVAVAQ